MKKLVCRLMLVSFLSVAIQSMEPEEKYYCLISTGHRKTSRKNNNSQKFSEALLLSTKMKEMKGSALVTSLNKNAKKRTITNLDYVNQKDKSESVLKMNSQLMTIRNIKEFTENDGIERLKQEKLSIYKVHEDNDSFQITKIYHQEDSPPKRTKINLNNNNNPQKNERSISSMLPDYWWVYLICGCCILASLFYYFQQNSPKPSSEGDRHSPKKQKKKKGSSLKKRK